MIENYLKIGARNLRKHLGYSLINVVGLAIGLACFVLIVLYVWDELSYDRFHVKADRIYRVVTDAYPPNAPIDRFARSGEPVAPTLRAEFPEVEKVARITPWNPVVKHENAYYYDDDVFFAEDGFFDIFSFPMVKGNPGTALRDPFTAVITEETRKKYYGNQDALGKSLVLNDTLVFTVTGVIQDVPHNSHFQFDILTSWETRKAFGPESEDWLYMTSFTYLTLQPTVSPSAFAQRFSGLAMKKFGTELASVGFKEMLGIQRITDIYLRSKRVAEIGAISDINYVYIFSAIALFVLIIACINFMNLATARSAERAREVGMRKVIGSSRSMLIRLFLVESVVLCLLALVLALVLMLAVLPFYNELTQKNWEYLDVLTPTRVGVLLVVSIVVGLLAGSYPAFVLSGFKPLDVLKGSFVSTRRGIWLRKSLVVFQFTISIALMISTIIVTRQLNYLQNQDLGFDEEKVLVLDAQGLPRRLLAQQYELAKQEFKRNPSVLSASVSVTIPGRPTAQLVTVAEGLPEGDSRLMRIIGVDEDFLSTMGIPVVAGRNFSRDMTTDRESALLINEAAVKNLGWGTPEQALGKRLQFADTDARVVGVIKDYHQISLKQVIEPAVLELVPEASRFFSLRIATGEVDRTIAHLKTSWTKVFPGFPFEYFFLDQDFDKQYLAEDRLMRVFGTFALFTILIACLGLFGLASFTAQQRTKEIGVRKVLGASVPGIVVLLSKDFLKLVFVAFVVAAPMAFYLMRDWLNEFAYRTPLHAGLFVLAGAAALTIAVLAVAYQAVRASMSNPVDTLRYE